MAGMGAVFKFPSLGFFVEGLGIIVSASPSPAFGLSQKMGCNSPLNLSADDSIKNMIRLCAGLAGIMQEELPYPFSVNSLLLPVQSTT